ncbi:SMC domain-containing protein [Thermacetogenium phaeum DSM 12270]|uniref:SMC domain-containing protein n=1 Tax=Thermacetogenium phaeum (strain ATCC BAA-254 / DSM 26808 / PB) TaxID=1089553 RepID=K4LF55_THEPS|nr:AAA family ATPase [Thermacetogenium phaeum]AFV11666.1 SMC domain-containing protein [Thermacetogenium phaeum DSM 12270]
MEEVSGDNVFPIKENASDILSNAFPKNYLSQRVGEKMITKITIKNFQPHAHTEIEPAPGLTVLVGESDQGKSAVIRALRWLFLNQPRGAGFVRAGESNCRVVVEYEDGTQVGRARMGDDNVYLVSFPGQEPAVFRGFGIETLAEIRETTGVSEIDVGGEAVAPNIAGQLEAPFLLGASGPMRASLIGMMARADVFDEALKNTLADISRVRREKRENDERIAELEEEIGKFDNLPALESAVGEASALLSEIESSSQRKEFLEQTLAEVNRLRQEIRHSEKVITATETADTAENLLGRATTDIAKSNMLHTLSRQISEASRSIHEAFRTLEATSGAGEAADLLEISTQQTARLLNLISAASTVKEAARAIAGAETVITATEKADEAAGLLLKVEIGKEREKALADLSVARKEAQVERGHAEAIIEVCRGIPESASLLEGCVSALNKAAVLKPLAAQASRFKSEIREQGTVLAKAKTALDRTVEEMKKTMVALGRCPVCFNPLNEEAVEHAVESIVGC